MLTLGQVRSFSSVCGDCGAPTSVDLPENNWVKRSVIDGLPPPLLLGEPPPNILPPPQPASVRLAAVITSRPRSAPVRPLIGIERMLRIVKISPEIQSFALPRPRRAQGLITAQW